jgi:hypothetical protein
MTKERTAQTMRELLRNLWQGWASYCQFELTVAVWAWVALMAFVLVYCVAIPVIQVLVR